MIALTLILKCSRGGLMRAADLDIHQLLHFVPEGGRITFAGEPVLRLDAVALRLLRNERMQTLAAPPARPDPTRYCSPPASPRPTTPRDCLTPHPSPSHH